MLSRTHTSQYPGLVVGLVLLLRLPFLTQAVQGDDVYYLAGAEHAQIEPLHPNHARYLFMGDTVDMRGHPHPPLDAWILGALLAAFGDIYEVPFHLAYTIFSIIAALSMWSLARRFSRRPLLATLLFLAVPAFVVNGNSFESDLPFLAFWMAAIALFIRAIEEDSTLACCAAIAAAILASLAAYQAIFLTPVLAMYLIERKEHRLRWWSVILAAPATLAIWQIYERLTSGSLPAAVLAGYMQSYGLETLLPKLRSAVALTTHSGWVVSPLIVIAAFWRGALWRWIVAGAAAMAALFYDPNPMFWASIACGVLLLTSCWRRGFLGGWVLIFFAGALLVFFAGSARYLLPIAAPIAILAADTPKTRILAAGFALQMAISLGLAIVNFQHWDGYRQFAARVGKTAAGSRIWINGEWGLRYYMEAQGGVPLARNQTIRPGDLMVSSALALPLPVNNPMAVVAEREIQSRIPLRLISLDGKSAYSSANRGLRPFEFSTAVIDRVRAGLVIERKVELSSVNPHDPAAASQIISGLSPDGWMGQQATVLLKRPDQPAPLRISIYIPNAAPARHIQVFADGRAIAEETFGGPGTYAITVPPETGQSAVTITLSVDKTFTVPADRRTLGVIVQNIGFR